MSPHYRHGRPPPKRLAAAALALTSLCGITVVAAPSAQAGVPSGKAKALFKEINKERAAHHLAALHWSVRLASSARAHDRQMARYNSMSHQLPHEAPLGARVTATSFPWVACGENIGWNTDRSTAGALELEHMMYAEKAPNDGHRRNILNTRFTSVGVDIYVDQQHHKLWLTTDFGATK